MAGALHAGTTPFWNPFHYAGHPSIADPQSLVLSPAFVLWALIDPKPSMAAFDLMVFAHLLFGGLAIAEYGRWKGWHGPACILAAIIFMLGGAVSSRLNHVGIIIAFGLFPIAHLFLERMLDRLSGLHAIGLGVSTAFIALGRTQVPLLLCFLLLLILSVRLLQQPRPLDALRARVPVMLIAAVCCVAVLSVPLLLTLQFAQFSNRPDVAVELALRSSLDPANFANFLVPNVFGSLTRGMNDWGPGFGTQPLIDSTDRAFNYLFCGSLTALLLAWHGIAGGRAFTRRTGLFAAIAVASIGYALGRYTPLFPFLFEHVPGISMFRRPVGGTFIFVLALAYICGHLSADYIRNGLPHCSRMGLLASTAGVLLILLMGVRFASLSSRTWETALEIAKALPVYLGLAALLALPRGEPLRFAAMWLAVAGTSGELVLRNAASRLNGEPAAYYAVLEAPTPDATRIFEAIRQDAQGEDTGLVRPRVEIVGLGGPWQNAAMVYGLEATNGYNPLRIGPYDRLVSPGESPYTPLNRRFPASFPSYDCLLGRLLGLQYVVLDRPIEQLPNLARRSIGVPILAGPKAWVYRLEGAVPRVTLQSQIEVSDMDAFVVAGLFPAAIAPSEVMVDAEDPLTQGYRLTLGAKPGSARIVNWQPDRVEITVDANVPAILSLNDPWYPGWEVLVDQVPRPVLRTNVLFRGVEVPSGKHHVEFRYRPLSLDNLLHAARGIFTHEEATPPAMIPAP
jgi:hypothetical protein